jgi:NADPH:quinone reductase-like Zn-dependent oxidoreductase
VLSIVLLRLHGQLVKSLGVDRVINYAQEDFSKNGEIYDVIFDTVGKSYFSSSIQFLKDKRFLILTAAGLPKMVRGLWSSITSSKQAISGVMSEKAE